ncbi:MAG TPA: hypothetical protein VLA19_08575 [Herpetosiphonaceae bacterium]|nr:hypothetical protein [Herpetosiphonaceae bacterium]
MARTNSFSKGGLLVGFLVFVVVYLLAATNAHASVAVFDDRGGMRYREHDGTPYSSAYSVSDVAANTGGARETDDAANTSGARVTDAAADTTGSGRVSDANSSGLTLNRPHVDPVEAMREQPAPATQPSLVERYWGFLVVLVVLLWALSEAPRQGDGESKVTLRFRQLLRRLAA